LPEAERRHTVSEVSKRLKRGAAFAAVYLGFPTTQPEKKSGKNAMPHLQWLPGLMHRKPKVRSG